MSLSLPQTPDLDCQKCPRLFAFRKENTEKYPDFFNAPVPPFGGLSSQLLVIGLAPGLKGANCTGRPFTGDYAGDLLYPTLQKYGFATGVYRGIKEDGFQLKNCRITNAVRCVPPQNKTIAEEEANCRPYLVDEIAHMPNLKIMLALGSVAHNAVLQTFGLKKKLYKFAHNAVHRFEGEPFILLNSYHCSRYNTNTGRLTEQMFFDVFDTVLQLLGDES